MAELKTQENNASVIEFIQSLPSAQKRQDSLELLELFERVTNLPARMWGSSIIGFGKYHYKSTRSSQEGDWPLIAFSPRKQNLTLYVMSETADYSVLLRQLGKHKTSVACLYINKLADIDREVLKKLVAQSFADAQRLLAPSE